MSYGIHVFLDQKDKIQDHALQKHCRRGSCKWWILLVFTFIYDHFCANTNTNDFQTFLKIYRARLFSFHSFFIIRLENL